MFKILYLIFLKKTKKAKEKKASPTLEMEP